MINVLETTKYVVENSTHVFIDRKQISNFAKTIKNNNFKFTDVDIARYKWTLEDLLKLFFVFNTINFCFWAKRNEEKWTIEVDGEKIDGAIALFRALENEAKRNPAFIEGKFLSELSEQRLRTILAGNVEIPLFRKRLECLHEAGKVLCKHFDGNYLNFLEKAENNAIKLVDLIVTYFPRFDDHAQYNGKQIAFYKRAQINAFDANEVLKKFKHNGLYSLDKLTGFADYKVPQVLRKLKILKYSKSLEKKIDNYGLIKKGSKEEIEIRACTIWSVEYIRQSLTNRIHFINSCLVDSLLWLKGQRKSKADKPYHRTETIAY